MDFEPNVNHPSVPPSHGPLSADSDIVIRTMASDLEGVARGGGLAQGGEHISMRKSFAGSTVRQATEPQDIMKATARMQTAELKNSAEPTNDSSKSESLVWALVGIAGIAFLALIGYALWRFLGQ